MLKLKLDKAEAGMVVTEDVKGPKGQVLLGKGVELAAKHIRILKTWGVQYITIEGGAEDGEKLNPTEIPSELIQQAGEELQPRFQHSNLDHPIVEILFKEAVKLRAAELNKEH